MKLYELKNLIDNPLIDVPELDYTISFENYNIDIYYLRDINKIYYDGADSDIVIELKSIVNKKRR